MTKNSFVSIYFSSNKLQIVKLSSSKKKVEFFATIDLPPGLIQNHIVSDEKSLSMLLEKVWHKLKINEKSVGIVIPEFSTFTKAIDLPKLEPGEMDEAVRWQAVEYIPLDAKDMILDWMVIGDTSEEKRVMAVAVNEKLLRGYISAADMAGLFPLVVETPSISLVRVAGENPDPKLAVYFSYDEIIITLSKGSEIITSSVVASDTPSQVLVTTLQRILKHFEEINITKIFIGGMPSNNNYVQDIVSNVKVPLEKLEFKVGDMNEGDIQKYIIPLSLQNKDPLEPLSSETINLLPPEVISKYKSKRLNVQIWGMMLMVTLIFVGCVMALTGTYFYMLQGLSKYKDFNSMSDTSYQKSKTASSEIKNVNTLADKTIKIDSVNNYPQDVLNLIYQKKPESIAIFSYEVDLEKGVISISGLSSGRDDLFNFKKKIEEGGEFQKVVLPLTSFEQGENIEFDMSFVYTKLALPSAVKK